MMNERGISLVESLLIIVAVGLLVFLLANLPNSINLITKSKNLSLTREIAAKQIEDKRNINYANLVNDNSPLSDPRLSLLNKGGGTVVVEDCDPTICINSESIKKITVTVTWEERNIQQTVSLNTFIGEGGLNQ